MKIYSLENDERGKTLLLWKKEKKKTFNQKLYLKKGYTMALCKMMEKNGVNSRT